MLCCWNRVVGIASLELCGCAVDCSVVVVVLLLHAPQRRQTLMQTPPLHLRRREREQRADERAARDEGRAVPEPGHAVERQEERQRDGAVERQRGGQLGQEVGQRRVEARAGVGGVEGLVAPEEAHEDERHQQEEGQQRVGRLVCLLGGRGGGGMEGGERVGRKQGLRQKRVTCSQTAALLLSSPRRSLPPPPSLPHRSPRSGPTATPRCRRARSA